MAEQVSVPAVDLGRIGSASALETAVLLLRTGGRPARGCTIDDHLMALARQAELDAQDMTDILGEVISAVLDDLHLPFAARAHANELMAAELLKAAVRWEAREPQWTGR